MPGINWYDMKQKKFLILIAILYIGGKKEKNSSPRYLTFPVSFFHFLPTVCHLKNFCCAGNIIAEKRSRLLSNIDT